jgi:hypothetical protein
LNLTISHGCFADTLESFDHLRLVWAAASGYGVMDYSDVGGPIMPKIDYDYFTTEDMLGEWPEGAPEDPLLILLIHEEKGGRIKTCHCSVVADRLEQLEPVLLGSRQTRWLLMTQQFIRGLRYAAYQGHDVVFS